MNKTISYEDVIALFHYRKDGYLTWAVKPTSWINIGDVAGSVLKNGYRSIGINRKQYYAHRLIYCYHHGYMPENNIDHIDGNPTNNKIENLREASQQCNTRNSNLKSTNKSSVKGVSWYKRDNKWESAITVKGKNIFLGRYLSFNDAVKARWDAEKKYNFPNCQTTSSAYLYLKTRKGK